MQESLKELDLALLNALQVRPRASWIDLAQVLGADAVTLARRWERLTAAGHAWMTCYPGSTVDGTLAYVEIDASSQALPELALEMAADPHTLVIEHLTGARGLLLTVGCRDLTALSDYVLGRLSRLPGVLTTRTFPVTRMYGEGSRWRLRALEPRQREALAVPEEERWTGEPDATDQALIIALGEDGRMPYADLAARTGLAPATVRRRVQRLLAGGRAVLRCEIAHSLSGWPVTAALWARVPPGTLEETARAVAALPEVRSCSAVTGPANLVTFLWLRSAGEIPRVEELLVRRFPGTEIVDRALTLRMVKRMGRILDPLGRSVGIVPMDLWRETNP
ncbi:Lrp/AsnC family transcriptional regulator [Nonomuraea sp. NPDC050556]|uniref:Lrp/AsnC family transcriptional regulator n=1 Tax=Nonomuraea sp. NPDC050556 TaxID=3364369 RepID=UPI0037AB1FBF